MCPFFVLAIFLWGCNGGIESDLEKTWVLKDYEGELATDEWKALMKLDTIQLDLSTDETFDALWYNPDTAFATSQMHGTWFVVPCDDALGKLVLAWDSDNMDRIEICVVTETRLELTLPFAESEVTMIMEAE